MKFAVKIQASINVQGFVQLAAGNTPPLQLLSRLLGMADFEDVSLGMNGRVMAVMPDIKVSAGHVCST